MAVSFPIRKELGKNWRYRYLCDVSHALENLTLCGGTRAAIFENIKEFADRGPVTRNDIQQEYYSSVIPVCIPMKDSFKNNLVTSFSHCFDIQVTKE